MTKPLLKVVQIVAVLCALVFVVALFANEPADAPAKAAGNAGDGTPAAAIDGADVFSSRCAGCHGSTGGGAAGPRLSGGRVVEIYPDVADQIAVVTDGRNGMPSFDGKLSEAEIEAVVEYTRTL